MADEQKRTEPKTYLVGAVHDNRVILELDTEVGLEARIVAPEVFYRALLLGVACLNTGKDDQFIMRTLAGITEKH